MGALMIVLMLSPIQPEWPARVHPFVFAQLRQVAYLLEVAGPHEQWSSDFRTEWRYVRKQLLVLADAPHLDVCNALPTMDGCPDALRACQAIQLFLLRVRLGTLHPNHQCLAILLELLTRANQFHLCVAFAQTRCMGWATRRQALMQLQHCLGRELLVSGRLSALPMMWHILPLSTQATIAGRWVAWKSLPGARHLLRFRWQ